MPSKPYKTPLEQAIEDLASFTPPLPVTWPPSVPKMPPINFEKVNAHASAASLMRSLSGYYDAWKKTLDAEKEVAIVVVLANGVEINATEIREEGFNGIAVKGLRMGSECLLLLHQASLQFYCEAVPVLGDKRKDIGFVFQQPAE